MKHIDKQTLILSTLCHLISHARHVNTRLDEIEGRIDEVADVICPEDQEDEGDYPVDADEEAIVDQLLDAADEIEKREYVPQSEDVARSLREIAETIRGSTYGEDD